MEATIVNHPLERLFQPRTVAVIGASTAGDKPGGRRWRTLVQGKFPGSLYPIHPTAAEVLGHRAYRSIRDVPEPIDLAVVIVREDLVPQVARDCAELRVPAVVVITGGFGETGAEGKRAEDEIVRIIRAGGGRVVGPNCAGVFSAAANVNVLGWTVPVGPVGLISQSGNMTLTFMQLARQKGLGFSKMITVGNAADLRVPDYVDYLLHDADTKVIVIYAEGFRPGEGRALFDVVRGRRGDKPVVILKPGQTESGRRAALSHTGSLAGEDRIVAAALRQCGVLRVQESEEAWDAAIALAQLPPMAGDAIVVISDGGGHATVVSDTAARAGLSVLALAPETVQALSKHLPPRSGLANPVDFAGQAEVEPEVIPPVVDVCLGDPAVAGVIFAGHFGGYFRIATEEIGRRERVVSGALAEVVARHGKPFVLHTIYAREELPTLELLREAGIPIYDELEGAAKAMGTLREWSRITGAKRGAGRRRSAPDRSAVGGVLRRGAGSPPVLLEPDARALVQLYGLPVPQYRVTSAPEESVAAARELGGRVVLKIVARRAVHKSDVGGVLLDLGGAEAVAAGHRRLIERGRAAGLEDMAVLVTPMLDGGVETVMGAFRDEQFGPVVMFGLGGILVEILDDVAFALAPLDEADARDLIRGIRGRRMLDAYRGRHAVDLEAAVDTLVRLSELVADVDEVREVDLNPVFLLPRGAAVADARVVLG